MFVSALSSLLCPSQQQSPQGVYLILVSLSFYLCEPQARSPQSADWAILAFEVCLYFHTHHTPGGKILHFHAIGADGGIRTHPAMRLKHLPPAAGLRPRYIGLFILQG